MGHFDYLIMTFHHVLKMAIATAWFNMASTASNGTLRNAYIDKLVRSCSDWYETEADDTETLETTD
jgi:hypothetical protein